MVEYYYQLAEDAYARGEYLDSIDYSREALRLGEILLARQTQATYTVVNNPANRDCLWKIAGRMYNNNTWMWPIIWRANKYQIQDPDLIFRARFRDSSFVARQLNKIEKELARPRVSPFFEVIMRLEWIKAQNSGITAPAGGRFQANERTRRRERERQDEFSRSRLPAFDRDAHRSVNHADLILGARSITTSTFRSTVTPSHWVIPRARRP